MKDQQSDAYGQALAFRVARKVYFTPHEADLLGKGEDVLVPVVGVGPCGDEHDDCLALAALGEGLLHPRLDFRKGWVVKAVLASRRVKATIDRRNHLAARIRHRQTIVIPIFGGTGAWVVVKMEFGVELIVKLLWG